MERAECSSAIEMDRRLMPDLGETFLEFLDEDTYPCVGAKSALARGSIETHEFGILGDRDNDRPILDSLSRFVAMIEADACDKDIVHTHVAIFSGPDVMSELRFEALLWSNCGEFTNLMFWWAILLPTMSAAMLIARCSA